MTEKEIHKMRPSDLVQLLLAQGVESAKLQESLEGKKERLETLHQENEALKEKLNDRDAATEKLKKDLDKSDAYIRELEEEMESLKADQWIDLKEIGDLTEAAQKLNAIFEAAQKEAEAYLSGEKPVDMPLETPKRKKNKKSEKKPLKSQGKDTDKENRSKELVEEILLQPDLEDTQNVPDAEALAPDELQQPNPQEPDAPQDVWPDEVPGDSSAGDVLQEPWPDEVEAAQEEPPEEPKEGGDAPKGLFRSLRFRKKRPKKEKGQNGAAPKEPLPGAGQSSEIPQ